ncbi:YolD-like family protein [Tumebacillus permanentifrigoris]|uniref:YolD-like protein n=1 Tax=Tumebacillus permanentifrigoris TaxID=378543 RepID=A0A316DCB2_9BACL|nr:YolD-like family protein [Tumebacillus permanentifrigoris]PWK15595.1 YolD-like protein [Tumebacillus permanentifrigoris]
MNRVKKLWEGHRMIIPEHRARMLDQEAHQARSVERPVLDEDALEEMQRTVQEAMSRGSMLTLQVYQDTRVNEITMVPKWLHVDLLKGYGVDGALRAVELGDIVGIC